MGEIERIAASLTAKQVRLLRAMPMHGAKKWRAVYRDAKVAMASAEFAELPFRLAQPTLTGFEFLTPLGADVKAILDNPARNRP